MDNEEANRVIDNFEIDKFYEVISDSDHQDDSEISKDLE